jgi:hypothetical protein
MTCLHVHFGAVEGVFDHERRRQFSFSPLREAFRGVRAIPETEHS